MWFTETAWPPIILFAVLAAGLLAMWYANQRGIFLAAAVGLLVACVAIYFIEKSIVTEREVIEQDVLDLTNAFREKDLDRTLGFVSEQASDLRLLIRSAIDMVNVQDDFHVQDLSVTMTAGNTRALSHFRANGTVSLGKGAGGQPAASRWNLTWQHEGGSWKVIKVQRLDVLSGEVIQLFDPR